MVDENHTSLLKKQFSLPHVINAKLLIAINLSVLGNFLRFKMN
jgi:hypothetical protein